MTLSVTGPNSTTNTTPVVTNSLLKPTKVSSEEPEVLESTKRCTTPVTVTFFGHSDRGKLEKVILPSLENKKQQPLSLLTNSSDVESSENDLNSLSPGGKSVKSSNGSVRSPHGNNNNSNNKSVFFGENNLSTNPFASFLTENNPFHELNPFNQNQNNPFRNEENGTNDVHSEEESLSSNKEVSFCASCLLFCLFVRFCIFDGDVCFCYV